MASNRQISKLNDRAYDVLKKSQSDYLKTNGFFSADIFSISSDAPSQLRAAIEIANRVTLAIFLQAVIDDDTETVKKCLDAEPDLISGQPDKNLVIESKLTWQKFYAEAALTMAVKRKQIKMIELLLPYYDKLEQTEDVLKSRAEALSAWVFYETKKNAQNEDEIVIPEEYAVYAQSLIDVFKEENFPHGIPGKKAGVPMNVALSEKTDSALESFLNILLPKKAVKLDDYIDPELFLLALYNAFRDNIDVYVFQNREQNNAFCVRIIGLAQNILPPEIAKIFCEGLYDVVEENRKISGRADSLKLLDGKAFYRGGRDIRSGLGFEYFCDARWLACVSDVGGAGRGPYGNAWKIYIKQKQQVFGNITQQLLQQPNSHSANDTRPGCVIC